jgi:glycerate 2-kinase
MDQEYVILSRKDGEGSPVCRLVRILRSFAPFRMTAIDLKDIYYRTLEACAPERLVARVLRPGMPRHVVAIGKCAGALLDGIQEFEAALVAIPEGYREPSRRRGSTEVHRGGHPQITSASLAAGRALIDFVDGHDEILFLISGGGSACVELPLSPWFDERDVMETTARLIPSGATIGQINCVRKHLSAIKGGRLGARVRKRSVTLVYSDVSRGALADVASGPTLADPTTKREAIEIMKGLGGFDRIVTKLSDESCPDTVKQIAHSRVELIADNDTLTATAASIAPAAIRYHDQIESDVSEAARLLLDRVMMLKPGEVLVAGGEPTVVMHGEGKGGRCSELAVRVALGATIPMEALFGSSDGVDGNSGVAGIRISLPAAFDHQWAERELARSNAFAVAAAIGETLTIPPSGNNLRDLYLLARS